MPLGKPFQPTTVDVRFGDGRRLERYRHPPGPGQPIPIHAHEEYQFGLSLDTAGEYRYRGGHHLVPAGAVRTIQAGEPHASRDFGAETSTSTDLLYLTSAALADLVGPDSGRPPAPFFPVPFVIDRDLANRFSVTFASLAAGHSWRLAQDAALLDTVTLLVMATGQPLARPAPAGCEPGAVATVKAYLDAHATEPVALADLARLTGLSPAYLCRAFATAVGVPPHRYQTLRRLERAKRLLAAGATAAETARRTGFADQSHLGRHFRRAFGVSPGRFRPLRSGDRPETARRPAGG